MLVLALSLVLVGVTAGSAAARLFPGEVVAPVVAAFLLAFAEIVAVCFALSLAHALTRTGVLAALAACALPALAPAALRPATLPLAGVRDVLGRGRRDIALVALSLTVGAALLYAFALGLGTPPNDWDSLLYHLPRAALWAQQGSISYIHDATDLRLDAMPPNAEIVSLFTMLTSGGDRFVALGQMASLLAGGACVYGIGRRAGLARREALFGGLLFVALPVLLLQAGTALNDVVVASLLLAATYFALGARGREHALAGLAVALALGTKFTTVLALPVLVLVVAAFQPARRWARLAGAIGLGLAAGSYWYVLNLVETGTLDGGVGRAFGQVPDRGLGPTILRTWQLASDLLELPATLGRGRWTYAVAGVALVVAGAVCLLLRRRRAALLLAPVGAELAVAPIVFAHAAGASPDVVKPLLDLAGSPQLVAAAIAPVARADSEPFAAGYGAVGVVMLVGAVVLAARLTRGRRRGALALALAPALFLPIFAYAVIYDDIRSRFLAYPVGLSAALWGLGLRHRLAAGSLVALTAVTAFTTLAFATFKPSGLDLLRGKSGAWSVWTASRLQVEEAAAKGFDDAAVAAYVERRIPREARLGLAFEPNTSLYPYLGYPTRSTVLVPSATRLPAGLAWLVVSPRKRAEVDAATRGRWSRVLATPAGWEILRAPDVRPS